MSFAEWWSGAGGSGYGLFGVAIYAPIHKGANRQTDDRRDDCNDAAYKERADALAVSARVILGAVSVEGQEPKNRQ